MSGKRPIVIAHRGASGYLPEHTLAAYFVAAEQGADFLEPDLVMTRDGVLVARHENEIGGTTDVAQRPEFAARRTRKQIDGQPVEGWFTEDFTLAELKSLRARERLPELRRGNTRFDGMFDVPTLTEIIALAQSIDARRAAAAREQGRPPPPRIGLYPETKHPSYFLQIGLAMERPLVAALLAAGYRERDDPVFIQSFETANLRALRSSTRLRLVQLMEARGRPYDLVAHGDRRSYADLAAVAGLEQIATYADAIGVEKDMIIPRNAAGDLGQPGALVPAAHAHGLQVHAWTFRAENRFLPHALRRGSSDADTGDLEAEIAAFLAAGVDGFFTDQPDRGVAALRGRG